MTEEQREIMRHALGLNRGNRVYRNHFVTGPGSTDYPHCEELVAVGLMRKLTGNELSGHDDVYSVTDAGLAELKTANKEVRGASRPAGEASSREAATSTVVLCGADSEE